MGEGVGQHETHRFKGHQAVGGWRRLWAAAAAGHHSPAAGGEKAAMSPCVVPKHPGLPDGSSCRAGRRGGPPFNNRTGCSHAALTRRHEAIVLRLHGCSGALRERPAWFRAFHCPRWAACVLQACELCVCVSRE